MTLCPIVDENDNLMGYKERSEIDPTKEYRRVSALRIKNSRGEILIAQRALNKESSPGKRGPAVAGTLEKGESYEDNIIKETQEEIGLTDIQFTLGPKFKGEGDKKQFTQWFIATVDKDISEFTIQEDEVAAVRWITKEEMKKEMQENPEKYIGNMKIYIDLF